MAEHKKIICYIDDSRDELARFRRYMEERYDIAGGVSIDDALRELGARRPDVFLLDLYFGPNTDDKDRAAILEADREEARVEHKLRELMIRLRLTSDGGFDLVERVAERFKNVPRAFFSRRAFLGDALRAHRKGVALLEKPELRPGDPDDDYDEAFRRNADEVAREIEALIPQSGILVFVSHSARDKALAEKLSDLLEAALEMPQHSIRSTSVDRHRLPAGADTPARLRSDLRECFVLVGLLTKDSLTSAYVLMELGAAWALGKTVILLLEPDVPVDHVPGPFRHLVVLHRKRPDDLDQLIGTIETECWLKRADRVSYQPAVDALVGAP